MSSDGYNHVRALGGSPDATFKWQPQMKHALKSVTTVMKFEGRTWPVAYFSDDNDETFDVSFLIDKVVDGDQWANLRTLLLSKAVLVWDDTFGNTFNCVVTIDEVSRDMLVSPSKGRFQQVHFTVTRVE